MRPKILLTTVLFVNLFFSCRTVPATFENRPTVSAISVDTLLTDSISIRALVVDGSRVWYSATEGNYGYVDIRTGVVQRRKLAGTNSDFRSIAQHGNHVYVLNAGAPATLYRISKSDMIAQLVYQEDGEHVFYDSMQFGKDGSGYAMGDPVDGCLAVIKSLEGGRRWEKVPCAGIGAIAGGEAAFAASNSTLVIKEKNLWMASGGAHARIKHSDDGGVNWSTYDTPIVQGRAMTGIFTADFYDGSIGVIAGGDYENLQSNSGNKAVTSDGGKSWTLVSDGSGPGYISSIKFLPGSGGREMICAGATGVHYSSDRGITWLKLSDDTKIFALQCADEGTVYASGYRKILRIRLLRE